MKSSLSNTIIINIILAMIYGMTSIVSQQFGVIPPGNATAIFAPSGIAFVAIFLFGYKMAFGVVLGSFIGNNNLYMPDLLNTGFFVALAIGIGAAIEGCLGVYLLKRFGNAHKPFDNVRSVWVFVLLSALVSCSVNATIGSSSLVLGGFADSAFHGDIWLTWWLGDAAGIVIIAPLLITWRKFPAISNEGKDVLEAVGAFLALLSIGTIAFVGGFSIEYLLIPILVFIVLRFGLHGATIGIFLITGFAIWGTVNGNGVFVQDDVNTSFLLLQAFISTVMFTALTLAAEDKERQIARDTLAETNRSLEKRVTERTTELAIATQHAETASRAKTLFIAQMSHEFRTPLNAIIGYSDLLLLGILGDIPQEQAERVNYIRQNAYRLLDMINDTLDISKIEEGKMTREDSYVHVRDFFEEILQSVRSLTAKKQIVIQTQYSSDSPEHLMMDMGKVQQIIVNLVGNAIKYTTEGIISIEIGAKNARQWFFCVRDTGIGMSPEALKTLFNAYTRVESDQTKAIEGTGLGLSITKQLVDFLQGKIEIESQVGKGSAFTVVLPMIYES